MRRAPHPKTADIRRRLLDGERQASIAAACKASPAVVAGIARRMREEGLLGAAVPEKLAGTETGRKALTPAQAAVAALVAQNKSTGEIASALGITVVAVQSRAKSAGIKLNGTGGRKGVGEAGRARIIELAAQGMATDVIAAKVKWSLSVVQQVLKAARDGGRLAGDARRRAAVIDPDVRAAVLARLKAGELASAIVATAGLPAHLVYGIRTEALAAGEIEGAPEVPRADDPELVARLRELAGRGQSAAQMAAALGRSRQWVAAACGMAGIVIARQPASVAVAWTQAEREALRAQAPHGIMAVMEALMRVAPMAGSRAVQRSHSAINAEAQRLGIVIAPRAEERAPEGAGMVFDDLPKDGCRWPIGLGPDGRERFCGAPVPRREAGGGVRVDVVRHYCAEHAPAAVVAGSAFNPTRQLAGAGR